VPLLLEAGLLNPLEVPPPTPVTLDDPFIVSTETERLQLRTKTILNSRLCIEYSQAMDSTAR
jgi:hypothetical protein